MEQILERLMARRQEFLGFLRKQGVGAAQAEDLFQAALLRGLEPWAALLEPPPKDFYFWSFFLAIADYNAADYWRKVTVPVLIVQAVRDVLIPVERSVVAMRQALREAGNRDYTIVTLPGVPHNLVIQPAADNGLKWPMLAPGYADLVTAWIRFRMAPTTGRKQ